MQLKTQYNKRISKNRVQNVAQNKKSETKKQNELRVKIAYACMYSKIPITVIESIYEKIKEFIQIEDE